MGQAPIVIRAKLNQAVAVIRIIQGYRTISLEAATALARFPPFNTQADMDAKVYDQNRSMRRGESGEDQDELEMLTDKHWRSGAHGWDSRKMRTNALLLPFCPSSKLGGEDTEVRVLLRTGRLRPLFIKYYRYINI